MSGVRGEVDGDGEGKKGQTFRFTEGLIQFHPERNHLMVYILFFFQWGFLWWPIKTID